MPLHRLLPSLLAVAALCGCGRTDKSNNSDPISSHNASTAHGTKAVTERPPQPGAQGTAPTTGTDSAGRPSDASGGTTGAGAGSGTSGTATPAPAR
jgi:hypothetical protein